MVLSWDCLNQICILKDHISFSVGNRLKAQGDRSGAKAVTLAVVDWWPELVYCQRNEDKGTESRALQEEFVIDSMGSEKEGGESRMIPTFLTGMETLLNGRIAGIRDPACSIAVLWVGCLSHLKSHYANSCLPKYLPSRMALALVFTCWHREVFCWAQAGVLAAWVLSKCREGPQRIFLTIIQAVGNFHLRDNSSPAPLSHYHVSWHLLLMVEVVDC